MKQPDMDEYWSDQPPDLAAIDFRIGFDAERQERRFIRRASGEFHQDEDEDINREEEVGDNNPPAPEGL